MSNIERDEPINTKVRVLDPDYRPSMSRTIRGIEQIAELEAEVERLTAQLAGAVDALARIGRSASFVSKDRDAQMMARIAREWLEANGYPH